MQLARWIIVAALVARATRAHAQSAEAESLFQDGDRLMAKGQFAAACEAFEASNRVEPRAGTLIRLGECREQNHQLASAWSAYKDALTRVKDPHKRDVAAAKAAELEPRLSYLTVSVPDDSRVDGLALARNGAPLDPLLWNRAVAVDGGSYTIAGRAPGHEEWQTTVTVPDARGSVSVDVPKFKELVKLVAHPRRSVAHVTAHASTGAPVMALSLAGTSAVALAAGIVLGVQANDRRHQAQQLCPDPASCSDAATANALSSAGRTRAIAADVGFAVASATAIAAAAVWWFGRSHVVITPAASSDHIGLAAVLRW